MTTNARVRAALSVAAVLTALVLSAGRAAEVPALLPGHVAKMTSTHVSCKAAQTSVVCKKAGGLSATITQTGVVRVAREPQRLTSITKPRALHNYDGFNVLGTIGVGIYCHVYVAGKPTMTCSRDDPSRLINTQGFDMSDRSVVVFRYDKSGARHDIKTRPQP